MSNVKSKKIFSNIALLGIGQIITYILSFATTTILARKLTTEDFGILNFAAAYVTYFTILASFGIDSMAVPELSKEKELNKEKINKILSFKIILTSISFTLLFISVLFIEKDFKTKATIITSGLSLLLTSINIEWIYTVLQEMKYISAANIIRAISYFFMVIIYIFGIKSDKVYMINLLSVVSILLANIYLIVNFGKKMKLVFKFGISSNEFLKLIKKSYPFLFSGIFALFNTNIDIMILGFIGNEIQVGLYSAAYKVITLLTGVAAYIYRPIYPVLSKAHYDKDYEGLNAVFNEIRKIIYIIALPIAILVPIVSKETISLLFGEKYIDATLCLSILLAFVGIFFIREIYGYALMAWGKEKVYMKIVMKSSVFNIISNLILIPAVGIVGAAVTTLFSEFINIILMYYYTNKEEKIKYNNSYIFKILMVNILLAIYIYITKHIGVNIIFIILTTMFIYCLIIFALKIINIKEVINRR